MRQFDRRFLLTAGAVATASGLAGCNTSESLSLLDSGPPPRDNGTLSRPDYDAIYGNYPGENFPIIAFDYHQVDPTYLRQTVGWSGSEGPGTIVIDPSRRYLYLVEPKGKATRFGVGVGREGFVWSGDAHIHIRRSWPDWVPPREMVARDPDIRAKLEQTPRGLGINGGPKSPLGARAMYLFGNGNDLGYRIHGTTEPDTIGTNVSSGCIRMVNQDICYLYGRSPEGTNVVVLPERGARVV